MKTHLNRCLLAGGLLAFATFGYGQIVSDDYWGGTPNDPDPQWQADVIGPDDVFDLTAGEVVIGDGYVTVNIYGNYFDNIISNTGLRNTSMGDLFISVDGLDWDVGGAATLDDYFQSPTGYTTFEYAVKLGTYTNAAGGLDTPQVGTVHQITSDSQIKLSELPSGFNYFREFQEFQIQREGPAVGQASWFINTAGNDPDDDFLSITIFGFEELFGSPYNVGFHWTMSCGNDVIEFNPVPEPATVGILGAAGLMGILFVRRRIVRVKKA